MKNYHQNGFTLIELLLTLVISGIIATVLYNMFFIVTRGIGISEPYIENDTRLSLITTQLAKDLQGIFAPVQSEDQKITPTSQKESPSNQPKVVDKVFYSINSGPNLNVLTFITNNPLTTYYEPGKGAPKPAVARVVYRLQPQSNNQGFSLVRYEDATLSFEAFDSSASKKIKGYELANSIKNISMEYSFARPAQDKAPTYESRKEWRFEEWKKSEGSKIPNRIPQFISMTITFFEAGTKNERTFVLKYEVPTALPTEGKASAPSKPADTSASTIITTSTQSKNKAVPAQ